MPEERTKQRSGLGPDTPEWFKDFVTIRFNHLMLEVEELKEVTDAGDRALRGYDGEPGLLTRFSVIEKKVDDVFAAGTKILIFMITSTVGLLFAVATTVIGAMIYYILAK